MSFPFVAILAPVGVRAISLRLLTTWQRPFSLSAAPPRAALRASPCRSTRATSRVEHRDVTRHASLGQNRGSGDFFHSDWVPLRRADLAALPPDDADVCGVCIHRRPVAPRDDDLCVGHCWCRAELECGLERRGGRGPRDGQLVAESVEPAIPSSPFDPDSSCVL